MAIAVSIETVHLEEIRDLGWPTDRSLVWSFRKTLQRKAHFSPIQLNRVWDPDANWHFEIIDGFHRYEAAKAEDITSLFCQVVELEEREARYARIHACMHKPSEVTRERALRELRLAFAADLCEAIGSPEVLYEPILGEDGEVHARPRTTPLPEEPLHVLEALADHLMATTATAPPYPVQRGERVVNRTPFGMRTGWEQLLNDWLADLGERFGETATWLLGVLRMQVLIDQGFGQGWTQRQRAAFQRNGGYGLHALLFWDVPDVELRAWFRRTIQAHPGSGDWFLKAIILLGFYSGGPQAGKPLHSYPKSFILTLLTRYPSPKDLYLFLHNYPHGFSLEPDLLTPPAVSEESLPQKASPTQPSIKPPQVPNQEPAIFAVGSYRFVSSTPQPTVRKANPSPTSVPPDQAAAYQPVHEAFLIWLHAIQELTTHYGRAWLHWELAQRDIAQLRAALLYE